MIALVKLAFIVSSLLFIVGLRFLSTAKKARNGNIIAGVGMAVAVFATFVMVFRGQYLSNGFLVIVGGLIIGSVIGVVLSKSVEMTGMPQLVSLFNATGGGCAMLLGTLEAKRVGLEIGVGELLLVASAAIGASTLTGSVVAYLKLAGNLKDNRFNTNLFVYGSRLLLLLMIVAFPLMVFFQGQFDFETVLYVFMVIALVYGTVFVFPIGGADMPVVISLLNSLTGVATALAGILMGNKVMVTGGILVGAAGIILTVLMCKAMNRSLLTVIAGSVKAHKSNGIEKELDIKSTSVSQVAMQLAFAHKIAIIPGYGLAVSQAQHACSKLQKQLEDRGAEVIYIIHPVAGRMPGHMNVLLAEAEVDYEKMIEMDEVNNYMSDYDVALIIGANDVVNPAAEEDEDSPLFGMPIIKAHHAKQVVVMKRGMARGYSGALNTLFGKPNCNLLFGDADNVLSSLSNELKNI